MQLLTTRSWIRCAVLLALTAACCEYAPAQAADFAAGSKQWTNSLGMVFVPVPHTKVLFSIWETRVKDFAEFAATNPKLDGTNWNHALYHNVTPVTPGPDYPVVNVSWNDANTFCEWLTRKELKAGRIPAGTGYRLPTDAEWSWAVRIGDRETNGIPRDKSAKIEGVFPWGTQFPPPSGAGNFADLSAKDVFTNWPVIEGYRDGYATAAPVGSFKPNEFGLYDLAGNALEWCDDWYDGVKKHRVMRGGAWNNCGPKSLTSSDRTGVAPERFSVVTGFRCVLVSGP